MAVLRGRRMSVILVYTERTTEEKVVKSVDQKTFAELIVQHNDIAQLCARLQRHRVTNERHPDVRRAIDTVSIGEYQGYLGELNEPQYFTVSEVRFEPYSRSQTLFSVMCRAKSSRHLLSIPLVGSESFLLPIRRESLRHGNYSGPRAVLLRVPPGGV